MKHELHIKFNSETQRIIIGDIENDQFHIDAGENAQKTFNELTTVLKNHGSLPGMARENDEPVQGIGSETPTERNQTATVI